MTTAKSDDFTDGPLYKKLVQVLPVFVQNPFSDAPTLNIQKLRTAAKKSHEAVYKWVRSSRLTPENATLLVSLANTAENIAALGRLDRKPPTLDDFLQFVFESAS